MTVIKLTGQDSSPLYVNMDLIVAWQGTEGGTFLFTSNSADEHALYVQETPSEILELVVVRPEFAS